METGKETGKGQWMKVNDERARAKDKELVKGTEIGKKVAFRGRRKRKRDDVDHCVDFDLGDDVLRELEQEIDWDSDVTKEKDKE